MIIMLGGKARAGKTTVANILKIIAEEMGMKPVILPFAKAIKDEAGKLGLFKDKNPKEYRDFCQKLGEEKRNEDPEYWIKKHYESIKKMSCLEDKDLNDDNKRFKERVIIVDDCRYMNEIAYARSIGAVTVFVSHGNRAIEETDAEWRQHSSEELGNKTENKEKDYDDVFDWRLDNKGSLEELTDATTQAGMVLLNVFAESLVLCGCEFCQAQRQKRKVDCEKLSAEVEELLNDYYKRTEGEEYDDDQHQA